MRLHTTIYKSLLVFFVILTAFAVLAVGAETIQAQDTKPTESVKTEKPEKSRVNPETCKDSIIHTGIAELVLLIIVLLVLPLNSRCKSTKENVRGLGLPSGSIRGMVALVIIGSMINFLLFGHHCLEKEEFDSVLDTITTLSVAVVAFYFANRTSIQKPPTDPANSGNTQGISGKTDKT